MDKLEELEQKYKELGEEIEKLKNKNNNNNNTDWRGKIKEEYYFIDDCGDTTTEFETNHGIDNWRYNTGNYFKSEKEALDALKKLEIYNQLKRLANRLNKGEKIDWTNNIQEKHYIMYNGFYKYFDFCATNSLCQIGQIYCLDENFLNEALKEIGADNLKLLFDVEDEEVKNEES